MTIAHKTKLSALAVALMVAATVLVVPPTTASAGNGVLVIIVGTAHLSEGLDATGSVGCFGGSAVLGVHGPDDPLDVDDLLNNTHLFAGLDNAWATFSYNNPNTIAGDAQGTLGVESTDGTVHKIDFFWERAGAVVVIDFGKDGTHNGTGVAAFAPTLSLSTNGCGKDAHTWGHPGPPEEHALVAGTGVITH